jgi:hypothetical protein
MVNPIYQQDEELLLNPFGSKYLGATAHTGVNSNEFVVQEDAIISVLTGGDASITENDIDYKTSMNLSGVTLKKGALIVAPVGEAFKSITIVSGAVMAYNSVVEGEKPGLFSFGNALKFDGINDRVETQLFGSPTFAFSYWLNPTLLSFQVGFAGVGGADYITVQSNQLRVGTGTGGLIIFDFTTNSVPLLEVDNWYHFFITSDGVNMSAYVNGELIDTIAYTSGITINKFGARSTNSLFFNGVMDEVVYWDETTGTEQDAIDLYNGGDGVDPTTVISSPNRYYKMNSSGSSLVAIDDGSDTENGTLVNFTPEYWVTH